MSKKIVGIMLAAIFTAALASIGITTTNDLTSTIFAQDQKFTAKLSGQDEVPPTDSQATGMADFTVTRGSDIIQK
jgi:hypothetical protein